MVISWLVSGLTFVIAVIVIIIVAKVLCNKEKKPTELERETRTCTFFVSIRSVLRKQPICLPGVIDVLLSTGVDNTYVALSINKL